MPTPDVNLQCLSARGAETYALLTRKKQYLLVTYRDGAPVDVRRVPSGMSFVSALGAPGARTLLLASQRGKGTCLPPTGKARRFEVPAAGTGPGTRGYLNGFATIEDTAYLLGYRGQIQRWDGTRFETVDPFAALPDDEQRALDAWAGIGHEGAHVFVVTRQLWRFDGGAWTRWLTLPVDETLPEGQRFYASAALSPEAGALLFAGPSGLVSVEPGKPPSLLAVSSQPGVFGLAAVASAHGRIYVTDNYGLFRVAGGTFERLEIPGQAEGEGIFGLQGSSDVLHVACKHGVHALTPAGFRALPIPDEPPA